MLPEYNQDATVLQENAIQVVEDDGVWNDNDYAFSMHRDLMDIIFMINPTEMALKEKKPEIMYNLKNIYEDYSYYLSILIKVPEKEFSLWTLTSCSPLITRYDNYQVSIMIRKTY
jgi:hypothetical protein